ncbi:threonine-phosphate decarboxylase CobD [Pelotomaculum isophthalicicum JI]|uniref:threonine-phosphate decarboxylase n=1 Tax=Pelotomaculum isophthalicicum JI TaxID=947010 RepID=A0A9X4GZI9_9FIRM|nr:threonine-phosphate decarboxylase CobD [Pelotomaculum isophthalicicum]MDF9408855.1 threonine-phosphate decarboxylase CobD [Pelotomaculum isophthalicicum JI]
MVNRGIRDEINKIKTVVHGGNWREASLQYGRTPDEMLDFSLNVNPLGPPAAVLDCLKRNLKTIQRYPDPDNRGLRETLTGYLGVRAENVMAGNGSMEILHLLMQTLKPRRALIFEPTFGEYRRVSQISGAEISTVFLKRQDGFRLNPEVVSDNLSGEELVFLCNPNNPTGYLIPEDALREITEICRCREVFLVVDESFLDFLPEWRKLTLCAKAVDADNMLVLRSLTKFFAMPGLRLGVAVANPALILALNNVRDPWNVNILAQMAGEVALKEYDYMESSRALIQQEKDFLAGRLADLGLNPFPAAANFLLVDISARGRTAQDLAGPAGRRGILMRDCSSFPGLGPDYIRLAVKDHDSNSTLLRVLAEILHPEEK